MGDPPDQPDVEIADLAQLHREIGNVFDVWGKNIMKPKSPDEEAQAEADRRNKEAKSKAAQATTGVEKE